MRKCITLLFCLSLLIACDIEQPRSNLEAMGIKMGIPIDEYLLQLMDRDSTWQIISDEMYSDTDSCYMVTLMHEPMNFYYPMYNDSISVINKMVVRGTAQSKTVFVVENEILTCFVRDGEIIDLPNDYILIETYYGTVYAQSMIFEEYPNYFEWTTRYRNKDNETFIKEKTIGRLKKGKENYNINDNTYQAMWLWKKCGECFITLDYPTIKTMFVDYKSVARFDKEKGL